MRRFLVHTQYDLIVAPAYQQETMDQCHEYEELGNLGETKETTDM